VRVLFTTLVLVVLVATTSAQQSGLHADAADVNDVWPSAGVDVADAKAFEEMVKGAGGRRRQWTRPPDLIVITSVLQFDGVLKEDYTAYEEVIDKTQADEMSQDLTAALGVLTAHKFDRFASIAFERAAAGARARVVRDGYIVVARFRGVREALDGVGYGGRMTLPDGTITSGTMMLDSDYDRTDHLRRLLRAHELGHALGYNHVESRQSIMNPTLGSEVTDFDRQVALIAFRNPLTAGFDQLAAR
jgi:hypothetical protein